MAKTEIDTIDGTPDKRMFWSIISDYDLATSLAELIDNAIDTWSGTADRPPLTVDLDLDTDRQIIRYTDNAGGVLREDLRLLVGRPSVAGCPRRQQERARWGLNWHLWSRQQARGCRAG